ncbi:hypothetical protein BOSE62_40316 [Bosea sp. 62]|nr:hypothetical protein BOSE46_120471 [Bosea sp. 46]CAD5262571.1 hypothetical protein BOSE21B_110700 [Bosea sp. 21B]CAD5277848.1 hypothetical protein BOSE7B_40517 [Bosea sp. 7B]VVT58765.1 hypothetical protein BOS5A_200749 [Bosea sp. EC-HK365B]VXB60209.1 hypothetical protein BOSE29B_110635 [Bosea sp. 29B]VXC01252.1 hypothetical protein BOSE125_160427 [Bosea sp. 125]VXC39782.1 hypothetical protein BOSE62_40316 [Bosea sp. 62]VXC80014.1 hypothetical protein BOSE127_50224 [Bosea sp. 127]
MTLAARRSARRVAPAAALALGLRRRKLEEGHQQVEIGGSSLVAKFGEHIRRLYGDIALQIALTGSFLGQKLQGQSLRFAVAVQALRGERGAARVGGRRRSRHRALPLGC